MPCGKDRAPQQQQQQQQQQPSLHAAGHRNVVDLAAMTSKSQKVFAKLPGLSNPLLQGLSSGNSKTSKTDISPLSFANKTQGQLQNPLNYDVGHVFGDMSVAQSGSAELNQALNNTTSGSSSNNLFITTSHNTLQASGETAGVCQSSPNTCAKSFSDISHQNASESLKNNNFYDNSNTQNVNCKMILSGTGRETSIPVIRTLAQPASSDQPIATGESPKPDLPSTSSPCRTETSTKPNLTITDPERLALIKQRKRERKFRKLQSLSALMRAPDDRHSMVPLNPLRHNRIPQENVKQDSGNSTGSSRLGDITQNPFNWMSSSVGSSATAGTGLNFEKKPWRADAGKKPCSFFHEPSLRNNSVLSENFSETTKNHVDYKMEKKLNESGSNSWQLNSTNSSMVDDALRAAALKHIKNESPLDDHLLLSASGKVLDINSNNKRIVENFLTPRVKKEDSGSESSSSVSSEEENSLSPRIKGLRCKEKPWGSCSKKHRPQSKFGGNVVKLKNGETDSSSLDHFRSPHVSNYEKRTRESVDYEASGAHSDKSSNTSEDETDNESDNNNSYDDDTNGKSSAKLFGNVKRKSHKASVKRRGRPPLSDKYKSQSHKTAKRRGRPPLMSNFGKSETLTKPTKPEKPTAMELDTKPLLKCKDDTADNKIPKRRGRPPKKLFYPASASASPTPMSIDTPTPPMALSSLSSPTLADGLNSVEVSPTSPPPPSDLTSEELLKARLNLPRRRGRPSKVDVMLREMAAAHLAAGQPVALPTPEAVAAALAQTAEVPAKKKKVYARRRYHAYGQRKRKRRKNTSLLRTLSTVAAEFDAGAEGGLPPPPSSELAAGGEEGASRASDGGVNFHQMALAHQAAYSEMEGADDDDEEEEEDEDVKDVKGKAQVYRDRGSTAKEEEEVDKALSNKRHGTDRHHRRHHRQHHHQLQESQGHNNNNNNNNNHHRQLPLSSSSHPLPPSANIVVSLGQFSHHAEPAGEQQQTVEEPNTKKRQKKRKRDAGGEGEMKRQRGGEVVSDAPVGGGSNNNNINNNNNNNNNSLKEVVKQEEEEESILLADGNTFRVKMMKSKSSSSSAKGPAPAFANLKGLKKEVRVECGGGGGGEEKKPAAAHVAEKLTKSRNKKAAPSTSFSSSSTKAGVIKISRNNNNNKGKINNNNNTSSSTTTTATTTTAPTAATTTTTTTTPVPPVRQIAPPVYNVPRVMLPPCIKDDGIACLMCGRVHTQDHFFKYMELKSTETSHRCPLCSQFFSWSCLFIEHMRGHPENTAQYRCEYCGSVSRKISSYFNCRITHWPPSQEWFDLQKACDDYLASLENKSSAAAAKKRRKAAAVAAAASSSTPPTKKKEGGGGGGEGGGRSRKKPSKQQEKDGANVVPVEKTQSSSHASQQSNASESSGSHSNNSSSSNKRKGQKQSKGRKSSADPKAPVKGTKPLACDVCDKNFPNLKLLTKHKEQHKTETPANWCKECNKQFSNTTHLNAHKCIHDASEGTAPATNVDSNSDGINATADNNNSCSSDSDFKCSICGAVFPDAVTHKQHVSLCDGLPESSKRASGVHKCSVCERGFKLKQSLLNHMRRHTGERPFVCDVCDKTFMQAGNLERHRRTHERDASVQRPVEAEEEKGAAAEETTTKKSDNKLFACEYCEKAFTVEAAYQTHLKEHEVEGSEQLHCPYCDQKFPSRHTLKLHKRTHNEHRPFKCSTCSRCYKRKHSLVEHQRNCR